MNLEALFAAGGDLGLDAAGAEHLRALLQGVEDPADIVQILQDLAAASEFKQQPVDVETFLLHPDFLGLRGQIFPQIADDLIEMLEGGYHEAVLCGGIGWGKSVMSECAILRMVYEVSCLRNPQAAYGLMEGSTIAFINASVNKDQAKRVVFQGIKEKVARSPYFRDQFSFDPRKKHEMVFPQNIVIFPTAGSEGGTIGYNVFGGILDEVNFWDVTDHSALNRGAKYDQARSVYDMLIRRMKSRFNQAGKLPGTLIQVSSSKYPDDFTEQRIQEVAAQQDKHTFVRRYANWDTKPADRFLPSKFTLYLGTSAERPAMSERKEDFADKEPALLLEVPMDFWNDFHKDIDGSIRDLAGRPTMAIRPFLPQREKILEAVERGEALGMRHAFTKEETTLQDGAAIIPGALRFDSRIFYYAHVDLAINQDAAGLAVGHVAGYRDVQRTSAGGELMTVTVPEVVVDFVLRVKAPEGGEIHPDHIRGLLLELRSMGCNLRLVTYDQYQSVSSIQAFNRMGIPSERFSVDYPLDAYNAVKEALIEDRLYLYNYTPLLQELVRLEIKDGAGKRTKVDHPVRGSKDTADAVAGVVYHCTMASVSAALGMERGMLGSGNAAVDDLHQRNEEARAKLTMADLMFYEFDQDPHLYRGDDNEEAVGFA